jgi:hypothetical protein
MVGCQLRSHLIVVGMMRMNALFAPVAIQNVIALDPHKMVMNTPKSMGVCSHDQKNNPIGI